MLSPSDEHSILGSVIELAYVYSTWRMRTLPRDGVRQRLRS
jgi:hypothetical protein